MNETSFAMAKSPRPEIGPAGIRASVASRSARGLVSARAGFLDDTYYKRAQLPIPRNGGKGAGLRFERTVQRELTAKYDTFLHGVPFIFYTADSGRHTCIPDGFMLHGGELVIFEIKIRHTPDAWFQLRRLYQPVVQRALGRPTRLLEVVKSYDPTVSFPEPHFICQDLETFLRSRAEVGCLIWGR